MCDIWQGNTRTSLSAEDLKRHLEPMQRLGVRHVVLTGGEPLLNTELPAICDLLHDLNIRITLLTTGLLLSARAAFVASKLDEIIISLDGPSDVHDVIRGIPRAFATIAGGIRDVRRLRASLPIACRTTVQKQNHHRLRATVAAAHSLQLNSISFLAADVWSTAFNHTEPLSTERREAIALNRDEVIALENEIDALIATHRSDMRSGFIVESEAKLRRIATRFREQLDGIVPTSPACNAPWVSAVMEADGRLRPCFFHPLYPSGPHPPIDQALNSSSALAFRSQLDIASNSICQHCVCSLNYRTR